MCTTSVSKSVRVIGDSIEKSCHSYLSIRKKNHRINLRQEHTVAYLKCGSVSILRNDNQMVTLSIEGPAIIGMAQILHKESTHSFRCEFDCEMVAIDEQFFFEMLTENCLWHHAFNILSHHLEMYFQREKRLIQKSVKSIAIENLVFIWSQGSTFRESTSVYTFILARNQVSRSSLHKIMAQLTEQGMIKLERGKLIWLRDDITNFVSNV